MISPPEPKAVSQQTGRTLLFVALVCAAVTIGVLWYIQSHRQAGSYYQSPAPIESTPQTSTPAESAPSEAPHRTKRTRSTEDVAQANRAEAAKKAQAAITEGDAFYQNGDYDNAIAAYQRALTLKPGDADIQSKIDKVKNAKAAEGRVNQ